MRQISLVGAVDEEVGDFFPEFLGMLEESPFLKVSGGWRGESSGESTGRIAGGKGSRGSDVWRRRTDVTDTATVTTRLISLGLIEPRVLTTRLHLAQIKMEEAMINVSRLDGFYRITFKCEVQRTLKGKRCG